MLFMIRSTYSHFIVIVFLLSILSMVANAAITTVNITVKVISPCDLSIQDTANVNLGEIDITYFDTFPETEPMPVSLQVTGCEDVSGAHITFAGMTVTDGTDGLLAIDELSSASGIAVGISKIEDGTPIVFGDDCADCGVDVTLDAAEVTQNIPLFLTRVVDITGEDEKPKAGAFTAQMTVTISKP